MRRLIVLGNCVAERLGAWLFGIFQRINPALPSALRWEILYPPPVFHLSPEKLDKAARDAENCDLVLSQPLFSYGACNTDCLRAKVGERLKIFSAPNFAAYFPDVMELRPLAEPQKFDPPMEWHSKIMVGCRRAAMRIEDVETIYLNHPFFFPASMRKRLAQCWQIYAKREAGVDIGTLSETRKYYASEPLFHTFNHPGDRLMRHMLNGMLLATGLSGESAAAVLAKILFREKGADSSCWSEWGFGFNAWPIITRHHSFFSFPGREWFRVSGQKTSIGAMALAWNHYYDAHPAIYDQALSVLSRDSF